MTTLRVLGTGVGLGASAVHAARGSVVVVVTVSSVARRGTLVQLDASMDLTTNDEQPNWTTMSVLSGYLGPRASRAATFERAPGSRGFASSIAAPSTVVPFVLPTSTRTTSLRCSSIFACVVDTSLSARARETSRVRVPGRTPRKRALGETDPLLAKLLPGRPPDEARRRSDRQRERDPLMRPARRLHHHLPRARRHRILRELRPQALLRLCACLQVNTSPGRLRPMSRRE